MGGTAKDESVMINNFGAAHKLLNHGAQSLDVTHPTFRQKLDLFFVDYDFIPLLVQENYLNAFQQRRTLSDLEDMASAADMISFGDQLSIQIRQNQNWSLLGNFGIFSSVAPAMRVRGQCFYPLFPQWLGKFSSSRKSKRLIREVKQAMAHRVSADRFSVQNEMVPLLLETVLTLLRGNRVDELVQFLDDLNLNNEMIKEHFLILSMNKKHQEAFNKISPGAKAAFTRHYNKTHQAIVKKKGGKRAGNKNDSESSDGEQDVLIDEEELAEIKKAKQKEREDKKAQAAIKRLEKLTKITQTASAPAAVKRAKGNSGKKKKKKSKKKKGGRRSKGSEEEELASDDSLNDFIADDDEDL